jgi:NADH:ubiquinone reductase (non-electrogenic)
MSKHQVCDLDEEKVTMKNPSGEKIEVPCGMLVWAAGNTSRPISRDLQSQLKDKQTDRRGLKVDDHLRLLGAEDSIFAIGDATATAWAPTAQAASQQGKYLAKIFEQLANADKLDLQAIEAKKNGADASEVARLERRAARAARIKPFEFVNNGVMASIGNDRAIADVPIGGATVSAKGTATYLLWRSAYLSMLFSLRNREYRAAALCPALLTSLRDDRHAGCAQLGPGVDVRPRPVARVRQTATVAPRWPHHTGAARLGDL